jgi:hypothetical protein
MPDDNAELWGVQHLAQLTGMRITNVRGAKSEFGPDEKGIDVVFDLTGRRFGAQHTVFHFDEGQAPGKRGSPGARDGGSGRACKTDCLWHVRQSGLQAGAGAARYCGLHGPERQIPLISWIGPLLETG